MITYSKNGLAVQMYIAKHNYTIALDPRKLTQGINVTTHGHSDHTPSSVPKETSTICSPITEKMIAFRHPKKSIATSRKYDSDTLSITLKDAGHCLGSKMAVIKNKESGLKILYTGDYNTLKKYCGQAKPVKADIVIVDSTFGSRKYQFPEYKQEMNRFLSFVQEEPTTVTTYSFGKPQEICHWLNEHNIPFAVDEKIEAINEAIGMKYKYQKKEADIALARKRSLHTRNCTLTGWASQSSFRYMMKLDEAFVVSDHADFNQGTQFLEKCNPEVIYTIFGSNKEFAKELQKEGFDARPLIMHQALLQNYY
jgi:putative mRNA 3-end processing factor